jgi:uncharacterized protein
MLVGVQFYLGNPKEIVISGNIESAQVKDFLNALHSTFLPNSVTLLATANIGKLTPLVTGRIPTESAKPRVFVCSNYACKLPSTTKEELLTALESGPVPS